MSLLDVFNKWTPFEIEFGKPKPGAGAGPCDPGYERRADGHCYPIDCGKGFVFDLEIGACVPVPEEPVEVSCPVGYEVRDDGQCYPIDCSKGFVFDQVAGACVKAPEKNKGDNGSAKQLKALQKQIEKLKRSKSAADQRHAAQLEAQRRRIEDQRDQLKNARSRPVPPVAVQRSSGPDLLSYAPYAAGAVAAAGGLFLLYRSR